jgi:hypothetical protein
LKNIREFGIKFLAIKDSLSPYNGISGIANITVFNITTGKYIGSDGLSYNDVKTRTFDTYVSTNYSTAETSLMYWISLVDGDEYDISVSGSGTKNPASGGYDISILGYYEKEPWVDGKVNNTLRFWHTDFSSNYYDFIPVANTPLEIVKTYTFTADGLTNTFTLPSNLHAHEFTRVQVGSVWLDSYNNNLTWGSNSPNYDDETMDSIYKGFTVNFLETPPVGNITVEFKPLINRYKIMKTMVLPTSRDTVTINTSATIRELDYSIEVV